jgi:ADP-ribose pyrophosphatase YjhB (NUDIX family)
VSPIVGVGAVVVKDGRAVIIKRGNEPYKGQWSIPGGRVEFGESLVDAVRREMREETGLEVHVGPLLGVFERIVPDEGRIRYHYVILDYLCTCIGGVLCAGDDAEDAVWVTGEQLADYDIRPSAVGVIRQALNFEP